MGDPGSAEHLAEVSGLVVLASAAVGVLGLMGSALVALAPARPAGYHPLGVASLSAAAVLLAVLGRRRPQLFSPTRLVYLLPAAVVGVAVTALLAGPEFSSLVTMFFLWFASSITYLPRRAATALMAWVGVVYAALLVIQQGNFLPVARWGLTVGMVVATALFMNRLVERSWALARGEQAARAQAELARAELEVVSAQKSRFLARMSHELRTPLNAIIGFSEVLARRSFGELNAKQTEYVADVVDSGRHLLALVDDLLDLAKVETGALDLDVSRVELAGLLSGSLALFEEQAARQRITLALDVDADPGAIEADARKLKQVVFNLLANAVRFTPGGGRVTLGARRAGSLVRIWVSDTGHGIAPEDRETIFEEFRQGATAEGDQGGTGLGLPLARRLVEAHGGRLGVKSELGAGSTFTAALPVRPRPDRAVQGSSPSPGERPLPLLLGEPDSPERRVETARLFGIGAMAMTGLAVLAMVIFRIHPVTELATVPGVPMVIGTALALACSVGFVVVPQWTGAPGVLPYLCTLPIVCVGGMLVFGGVAIGLAGFAALAYAWVAVAIFPSFTPRQVVAELALIGAGLGVALALEDGYPAPLANWVVVMGFVMVTGLIFRRFVDRIQALALAERSARGEAERVRAALEVASRHKSEFLANMSHELRTPLNVIIGFSEVLASEAFGPLNEKQAEYVADVLASGRHLLGLINDILDLAKADAGRMELQLADLDVDATLAAVVRPFQEDATRRRVTLHLEAGPGRMHADEAKLTQALGHLVSNALKFTPDGGTVTVRAARDAEAVEISVTDTGRGVASGDFERIFDAFAHGDGSAATEQGSGLGLALARRYAELHGGSLTVRSDPGSGATFSLHLPVSLGTDDRAAPAEVA
jgi:signal transduction histidine kinase